MTDPAATTDAAPPASAPIFYVPATSSLAERRPRILKHGDTFAAFDHYGDIVPGPGTPDGLFHEDTRYLSQLELRLDGQRPLLLSSTIQDDNAILSCDLTNPDLWEGDRLRLPGEIIQLTRSKFLWRGGCYERIGIRNFDRLAHRITLAIRFSADFADLFEVRGHRRKRRGTITTTVESPERVAIRYQGIDGTERSLHLRLDPAPTRLGDGEAVFELELAPRQRRALFLIARCGGPPEDRHHRYYLCLREARRALRATASGTATVASSSTLFNDVMCRATADLHMLITDTEHGPYPYAGIPWFSTAFGRDGLITALSTLWADPGIARGVLRFLAATQATEERPEADAQPGKIVHEIRKGEMARLGEVPFGLYYGSVDATPLFVLLLGRYFERTGDSATVEALWPNVEAALAWIDDMGDLDGDGLVEYARRSETGLDNQGWKDSWDSIFHEDGSLARGPIALAEVQGYVYAAKRAAADLARLQARAADATRLAVAAEKLRQTFEESFWCEDLGCYALALDGDKRPCRVVSSNAGHALLAGIAAPERARRLAETFIGRDCFSGWGIRTVAASAARYNPMSYHNGSVWPHDNALIAQGLAAYGEKAAVLRIFEGLIAAASYCDLQRLPELLCGTSRRERRGPTFYPVACAPQAWASAAPFALLQASLGLECDALRREVRFKKPMLPAFLDEMRIHDLRVGDARLDLLLRRHASDVAVNVLQREGDVRVSVEI